jgi:hypothetical protein
MKKFNSLIKNLLVIFILITGINQVIFGLGPYYSLCFTPSQCEVFKVPLKVGLCNADTYEMFAYNYDIPIWPPPCLYGTFQWYTKQWCYKLEGQYGIWGYWPVAIEGATSNAYTVTEAGPYWCDIDCGSGVYQTDTVQFYYFTSAPSVITHPESQSICIGEPVTFSISASSVISYQWQKKVVSGNWTSISDATSNTYTYTPTAEDDQCKFRCYLPNNGCGYTYSNEATLDIIFSPTITSQPVNATVCQEGNTSFTVTASGDISTYSWEYSPNNGTYTPVPSQAPFSGINTSQLTLTNVGLGYNNYYFRCKISNSCFTVQSNTVRLFVQTKLTVNSAPSGNYYVCDGSNASFSVSYSGTSPISVQWQEYINGWSNISGQTSSTLTFPVSISMNNRQYRAVITQANACNTTINTTAGTLLVNSLPAIETQPESQEECLGDNVTFSIVGSGTGVNYHWQINRNNGLGWKNLNNGGHYSGVTTANLGVSNLQDSIDGFQFRCIVGGTCSPSVTSDAVNLIVDFPPVITATDQNQVKCIGQPVTIKSYVSGTAPLLFKWRRDGVSLTDWISSSEYTIPAVGSLDAGKYDYLVKNVCNAVGVESDDVTLTVNTPPTVNIHPVPVTICEGSQPTVKFTISSTGGTSLQWQVDEGQGYINLTNNATYSGVTTSELTISNPSSYMDQYQFRCQVIGSCDPPITSNSALLTVKTIPEILVQPENDTVCFGASANFSVTASSNIPMEYKWKQGGQAITGWLSINTLVLDDVTLDNDDNYQVMVRNECAYNTPVNSELAYLKVIPPPNVSLGADRHLCPGSSLELDPGTDYESYSWSTGETTRSIEVTEQGNYTLNVTDINGCTNSDKVYVYLDPSIPDLDLGSDRRYCLGEIVSLDATDQYDSYIWKKISNPDQTISTNRVMQVTETDSYIATVSKLNSVCTETDTVHIIIAEPFDKEQICLVTVDPETDNYLIVFEKTPDQGVAYYNIYRQTEVFNQYDSIGSILVNELSVFEDKNVNPREQQYVYKISAVDTCGNESELSLYHKTLLLQYDGSQGGVNLRWDKYEVQGVPVNFASYIIYRGTDSTILSEVKTISGDMVSWVDTDPIASSEKLYYRIAGVKTEVCDPANLLGKKADSGPYSHSMSNIEDNRFQTGFNKLYTAGNLLIYPNPTSDNTTVSFPNPEQKKFELVVRDLSGKMVMVTNNITEDKVIIESGSLKSGYYSIEVVGDLIYRGKLIIE